MINPYERKTRIRFNEYYAKVRPNTHAIPHYKYECHICYYYIALNIVHLI